MEIGSAFGHGQCAVGESVREIFGKDDVRISDNDGTLDGVFQFANVAGPIVLGKAGAGGGGESANFAIRAGGVARDEVIGEERDVLGMLAKGGHGDRDDGQAVVKIEGDFFA